MNKKAKLKTESIVEDALTKISNICNKANEPDLPNEENIKFILVLIFTEEKDKTKFIFPDINRTKNKNEFNLIIKFVDLLFNIFQMAKKDRISIYSAPINTIKENNINNSINSIQKHINSVKRIKKDETNLDDLYKILFEKLKIQNEFTINTLIDVATAKIGFILNNHPILKYIAFCLIKNIYLKDKEKKPINFWDCEIDVKNRICFQLLIDLFSNKIQNNLYVIFSYIILRFKSFKDTITNYDLAFIQKAAINSILKIENVYQLDNIISVEKIVVIFTEEYEKLLSLENKNKIEIEKINEIKPQEKEERNIFEYVGKGKKREVTKDKKNEKIHIDDNEKSGEKKFQSEKENKIFEAKRDEQGKIKLLNEYNLIIINDNNKPDKLEDNDKKNLLYKINNFLNNNKNKMDSKMYEELKNIFDLLIKKIDALENKNSKLEDKNSKLEENIKEQGKKIINLEGAVNEIKNVLGQIQTRDLSKNFIGWFNRYLTKDDIDLIQNYKNKKYKKIYSKQYEIISKRLKENFHLFKETEKFKIVDNLLEKVCDSLDDGNTYAHSLIIDNYLKNIDEYLKEKNIFSISCPQIFCFLLGIGLNNNFDETYSFLSTFFDKNLDLKTWKDAEFMDIYLKNN